jgi:hypothetical protein
VTRGSEEASEDPEDGERMEASEDPEDGERMDVSARELFFKKCAVVFRERGYVVATSTCAHSTL